MSTIIFTTTALTVLAVWGILRYIDSKDERERKNNGFSARDLDGWIAVERYFRSTSTDVMRQPHKTMADSILTRKELVEQCDKSKKVKVKNDEK